MFSLNNRRYVGSKYKLLDWLKKQILSNCRNCKSFCDLFAGTGVVVAGFIDDYKTFYINDLLYSNEVVYKAFFLNKKYNMNKLNKIVDLYNKYDGNNITDNYISINYGNKYFAKNDAKIIGKIRADIEDRKKKKNINMKEYSVLIASLLYSLDKVANTVGHYDAYIKNKKIADCFHFELIQPLSTRGKSINIFRKDANLLGKKIESDIVFLDPPYNSRQYSRFYHVLENITEWKKPKLTGVAMKPNPENMSEYCKNSAYKNFEDLIKNLHCKYIVVTYNNTYNSKSHSSKNKIDLESIKKVLSNRGKTKVLSKPYRFFNAGKTNFPNHKEFLFITKTNNEK